MMQLDDEAWDGAAASAEDVSAVLGGDGEAGGDAEGEGAQG